VEGRGRRTIALRLEYDGSAFAGSQLQANGRTVQGELEQVLQRLTGAPVRIRLAGRTDAGVHASGQVAAAELPERWQPADLQRALNALLPEDLAVNGATDAPDGFDPRRRALWRCYRYTLLLQPVRSPLRRRAVWQIGKRLDLDAMRVAAAVLLGEHDFAAFGAAAKPGTSTVRRMDQVSLCAAGPLLRLEFTATAFMRGQVRRTVGQLVEVGRGKESVAGFVALVRAARPGSAGPAAPPRGLCLVEVAYSDVSFAAENDVGRAGVETER
jgi:tRNA pseudouridine38-40 synthase